MVFSVARHLAHRSIVAEDEVPTSSDRSVLRSFLTSIATMTGDLSNITAPSSILAPKSTVEVPSYQGENPTLFCAGADSEDPAERAMLVLRSFLSGLVSQCYMGHDMTAPLKKPLNAFLGEVFLATWQDSNGTTTYVGEQVSHHPPITACRIWNEKHGVMFQAHNRSSITFSTCLNVHSTGHAVKTFTNHNEHYLIPIPDFKVKGLLSSPYPELTGTYYISSTSGYISSIRFTEPSFFGTGNKQHSLTATVYQETTPDIPIYTLRGQWHETFTIHSHLQDTLIETFSIPLQAHIPSPPLIIPPLSDQDDYESQKAWLPVTTAIRQHDMRSTTLAKSRLEQAQRQTRKVESSSNTKWETKFFKPMTEGEELRIVEGLMEMLPLDDARKAKGKGRVDNGEKCGWRFDREAYEGRRRPFHGVSPDGRRLDH